MLFHTYGNKEKRSLLLIHGLGVSHEIVLCMLVCKKISLSC